MPQSDITLKSLGLFTDPSELTAPPGSLKTASNVIIRRDNITEPRRGFRQYGTEMGTSSDRAKQIFEYRDRILRHYSNVLQWDTLEQNVDGESIFQSFTGDVTETQEGLRIKSVESNGNFYFTTADGIKKIAATDGDDLANASIVNAGGIKAINIDTFLDVTLGSTSGFLPVDSTVAYRVLWVKKDINNNLIRGVPSERSVIYNSLQQMIVRDMLNVLSALDSLNTTGSYIDDGDYVDTLKLPLSASATQILTNLIALTEKIDAEFGNLTVAADITSAAITGGICTITFDNAYYNARQYQPGDKIYLDGWTYSGGNLTDINGVQTVITVAGSGGGTPTITFATSSTVTSITPGDIQSGWFRAISIPSTPSTPATHDQLEELHNYLNDIIIELQSSRNIRQVAQFGGTPLDLTNVTGSGVEVEFTTAPDDRDYLDNGDLIFISGSFSPDFTSVLGVQTVNSSTVTGTTFAIDNAASGTYTGSPDDTIVRILRFTNELQELYITPLQITTTANVLVEINIPHDVTTSDIYQIYRSDIKTAEGTDVLSDLIPDDNMRQVYEDTPTQAQIDAGEFVVEDIVSDIFFQGGAFLYTNPDVTGGGILQANEPPPFAKDINRFKNVIFYANTRTLQRKQLALLGVTNILTDYNDNDNPSFTISVDDITSEYRFVKGEQQAITLECDAASEIDPSAYFLLNSADNFKEYYVWFDTTGSDPDPAVANKTGIKVIVAGLTTAAEVAQKISDTIAAYVDYFNTSVTGDDVMITNAQEGRADFDDTLVGLNGTFTLILNDEGAGQKTTQDQIVMNFGAANTLASSGTASYFTINTPFDRQRYYFWYNVSGGTMTNPSLNGRTAVRVDVLSTDTADEVATKTKAEFDNLTDYFTTTLNSNTITSTTVQLGETQLFTSTMPAPFTWSRDIEGALDVLLSDNDSVGIAVEATAKSLVSVVNHDRIMPINGFYISGLNDVPGLMLFETDNLSSGVIYFTTNLGGTGSSFSPSLAPTSIGISNTAANPTVITYSNHGLVDGDEIFISGSNSFPVINGIFSVTRIDANTFSVPVNVITSGNEGSFSKVSAVEVSDNEVRTNRIYYSKLQEPEAVPIVNYFDVGSSDKEIVRIFPLMDSLFVFKKDGLYRVSGETAPWTVALFDSSCTLIVPDSLSVTNNFLFGYTEQGITSVSENGVITVSEPIATELLKLNTNQYASFTTASWGVGYDTDNSYLFFTVKNTSDTVATICYRYSTLTPSTWTTYDKSETCGIVYNNNLLYFGSGIQNTLEQERKTFTRIDYADYEFIKEIVDGGYSDNIITFTNNINDIKEGDVVVQEQPITIYNYNMLLKKLDIDPGAASSYPISSALYSAGTITFTCAVTINDFIAIGDVIVVEGVNPINYNGTYTVTGLLGLDKFIVAKTSNPGTLISTSGATATYSYYESLHLSPGANMRTALETLANKLDIDPSISSTTYASSIANYSGTGVSASAANPTVITDASHGLLTTRYIQIAASTTSPNIDGRYNVTVLNANTFTVPENVLTTGTLDWETLVNDFNDIKACFNIIIDKLNAEVSLLNNYQQIDNLIPFEAVIIDINYFTKKVTLNKSGLNFIVGPITVYESYLCDLEYLPTTLENFLAMKQFSEAQYFFLNKTFTEANLKFSSDLIPMFTRIPIEGFGNGVFGNEAFGENYFGGDSHSAPFRTYVPRANQRSRFLRVGFEHQVAREKFSLIGITVSGRQVSIRAFR